jgi:predicted DNA-binding transcriptional regulator YafY
MARMTIEALADHLGVSERTARRWLNAGMPRVRVSRKVSFYDLGAVMAWLQDQAKGNAA